MATRRFCVGLVIVARLSSAWVPPAPSRPTPRRATENDDNDEDSSPLAWLRSNRDTFEPKWSWLKDRRDFSDVVRAGRRAEGEQLAPRGAGRGRRAAGLSRRGGKERARRAERDADLHKGRVGSRGGAPARDARARGGAARERPPLRGRRVGPRGRAAARREGVRRPRQRTNPISSARRRGGAAHSTHWLICTQ